MEARAVTIVSASVTGTAVDVAERIGRRLRREQCLARVTSVDQFDRDELLEAELVIFVLSTTGNGTAPPSFVPLWQALLHPQLPADILDHLRFAVFGLGDSSYPRYNWVAKKMFRRLNGLGAEPIVPLGEGDDQNDWGIESTFPAWLDKLVEAVDEAAPPRDPSFSPLRIPPARVQLVPVKGDSGAVDMMQNERREREGARWALDTRWATMSRNERTTAPDHWQDVRTIDMDVESLVDDLSPGDVLEIRPEISDEDVNAFLKHAHWEDIADVLYEVVPISEDQPLPAHLPRPLRTTVRSLLKHELDILRIPQVSFFEWLAHFVDDPDLKEKLEFFCTGEGQDELIDYTHRPRRTLSEVMHEFRSARVPPQYLFDLLPLLRPRGFSIARILPDAEKQMTRIELLVAIVKYKTIMSVPRKGVCTAYLANLKPGTRLPVRFDEGTMRLPKSLPAPIVMVGPGTGVAPFVSFLDERARRDERENLLFFGCRNVAKDFHYRAYLEDAERAGMLRLSVAASRDQEDKIYVQQRVRELKVEVWDAVQRGGYIFICGSSKQMPKLVRKALVEIIDESRSAEEREAEGGESFYDRLEAQGRIQEETW